MFKFLLIFISLFYSSLFKIYLPISKLASEFYKDGMCYYSDGSDKVYVNSCKKGEYCQKRKISNNLIIGLCLIYKPDFIKVLEEKCSTNFECDINLICSEKCTINTAHLKPYSKSTNDYDYYYCQSDYKPIFNQGAYTCENIDMKGYCLDNSRGKRAFPDYSKVCGQIELVSKNIKMNEIGEIKVKNFVEDEKACESGFALFFNENLNEPLNSGSMLKYCVNFKESKKEGDYCLIKYTLEEEDEFVYNTEKLPSSLGDTLNEQCEFLDIKINNFKKYLEKMSQKKSECQNKSKIYSDPFTCGIDELREYLYFYKHPENYALYKDEEDILHYLFQEAFPLYGNNDSENTKEFSSFLNIKYFISLLFLLYF